MIYFNIENKLRMMVPGVRRNILSYIKKIVIYFYFQKPLKIIKQCCFLPNALIAYGNDLME